jgi:hypothetical protein
MWRMKVFGHKTPHSIGTVLKRFLYRRNYMWISLENKRLGSLGGICATADTAFDFAHRHYQGPNGIGFL